MKFSFPSTRELTHVVRNRVSDTSKFIGKVICPIVPVYASEIEYDVLYPAKGMTSAHKIGTNPKSVQTPKQETKRSGTAYWKDKGRLDEEKLLNMRKAGTLNERAAREAVMQLALQQDTRLDVRVEWLIWKMLTKNAIEIDENNVKFTVVFNMPNVVDISADVQKKWTATATSDPVGFITALIQGYRGTGAKARTIYMNSITAGYAIQSTKFVDLLKQSSFSGYLSPLNADGALKLLFPNVDFVIYDEGYLDDNDTFQPFLADGDIVAYGDYPSEKVMDFGSTISLHNGGLDKPQPGKFTIIKDKSSEEENPYVDVTVGIYGLPRLFHPDYIRRGKVF
ncbi:major capsid protein [Sporomusa sp. KB1]|jgi:hypothetical protein|uniref:major capsid protein n=1 Tax=Sporomusa sp. KB1 TaxID=943346 RepID=UPI0011A86870|nr:major capsid protein [Sporomusa sp. KB1]TWH45901.1 major capsid protein E [Sporomusa sp. KB1]